MKHAFGRLTNDELRTLGNELQSGRLALPGASLALQRWLDEQRALEVWKALQELSSQGFTASQAGVLLQHLLVDRQLSFATTLDECLELVLTGPAEISSGCRDTQAVVQSLFASAVESVDVVGFAVYKGRRVFHVLAERMKELPSLEVRFFLNVPRKRNDVSAPSQIVQQFLKDFRKYDWPGEVPLPVLYYDPRSLQQTEKKASLHAKCVLVDGRSAFISSANFTEAAHERNIEAGVLIQSPNVAKRVGDFLDDLSKTVLSRLHISDTCEPDMP